MSPTETARQTAPQTALQTGSMLCSDADQAVHDDPAGSAAEFSRFLLIEHLSSFGREAADDALAAAFGEAAHDVTALPGLRAFAIRPVGRSAGQASRPRWIGRTGENGTLTDVTGRPTAATLDDLARPVGAAGTVGTPGTPGAGEPLFAVCTNGSRDRCCAVKGRDLALALHSTLDDPDDEPSVVEISHLGGHRFAPTMLVLPWGYTYARLDLDTALEVAHAALDGLVVPTGLRGRADLPPAAQVAEAHWRSALGTAPVSDVRIDSVHTQSGVHTVTGRVQGRVESLALRRTPGPTIEATLCGGKPIATGGWVQA